MDRFWIFYYDKMGAIWTAYSLRSLHKKYAEDENWGYTGTDANGTAFQMTFFHAHKSQKLLVLCFKPYYNTDYKWIRYLQGGV